MPDGHATLLREGVYAALAASRLGVLVADAAGIVRRANPALSARTGHGAAQLTGQALDALPLWPAASADELREVLAGGQAWQGGLDCEGLGRSVGRVALELSPITVAGGGDGEEGALAGWLLLLQWPHEEFVTQPADLEVAASPPERGSRRQLLADLRVALQRDELRLHYQPQLSLFSGEIVGVEALLRWAHPERGLLPPRDFIPLAEAHGLIIPISEWVVETACHQAAAWRAQGLPALRMGVNLSARHFRFLELLDTVRGALRRSGLAPRCLDLELTESVMMQDVPAAIRTVDALKALGVRLSLDDFGTGHSSLAYLSRFAIDTLKIDRSFVHDLTTNDVNAAIVSATIAMAHKLGKSVIAEGVETEGQLRFLRGRECDEMQGFLYAPGLPADEVTALLTRGDRINLHGEQAPVAGENRLLLVDDEPNILTALRRLLRREGYAILTAADGTEALELLAHEPVQVIVTDQRMPGMSGTELLGRVKSMYPHTVRIALSGYADVATVTDAVNRGAIYRYLAKPWDDEALKTEIRDAFRHWRSQRTEPGGERGPA
ncbi:hypothetical protein RA210_U50318 [Rubrivivax sp. A210]|uniref:EAL domain-containing protein n=1 Tax=Rubrivivax sp. A210 TaxID=2772301 RepID=UPI0019191D8B|nr:EAL domain-containing protein [Rubrivivax sp. A210]CAD5374367.1 hypothetical protein RA210_U50318 [Rubrivivax sp. A210]